MYIVLLGCCPCSWELCLSMIKEVAGEPFEDIVSIGERQTLKLAEKIFTDSTHPLFSEFKLLPSGRRFQIPQFRTNRATKSFVPNSIRLINTKRHWVMSYHILFIVNIHLSLKCYIAKLCECGSVCLWKCIY